jgi:hypothetical protein
MEMEDAKMASTPAVAPSLWEDVEIKFGSLEIRVVGL